MEEIILVGGGGHCKSVIDVIEQENKYKIAGIIDKEEFLGKKILGYEFIGTDSDLEELFKVYKNAFVTVGHIKSNFVRIKLFNILKAMGYKLPVIVSPLSYVSKHSFLDEGSVVMHNVVVNADVKIGKNCIINTNALVEHDSIIEDNCHVSTAAVVNGGVILKENTFFGSNSASKEYIEIDGFVKGGSFQK